MDADYLTKQMDSANKIMLAGLKSGQTIGWREGMLHAAELCDKYGRLLVADLIRQEVKDDIADEMKALRGTA